MNFRATGACGPFGVGGLGVVTPMRSFTPSLSTGSTWFRDRGPGDYGFVGPTRVASHGGITQGTVYQSRAGTRDAAGRVYDAQQTPAIARDVTREVIRRREQNERRGQARARSKAYAEGMNRYAGASILPGFLRGLGYSVSSAGTSSDTTFPGYATQSTYGKGRYSGPGIPGFLRGLGSLLGLGEDPPPPPPEGNHHGEHGWNGNPPWGPGQYTPNIQYPWWERARAYPRYYPQQGPSLQDLLAQVQSQQALQLSRQAIETATAAQVEASQPLWIKALNWVKEHPFIAGSVIIVVAMAAQRHGMITNGGKRRGRGRRRNGSTTHQRTGFKGPVEAEDWLWENDFKPDHSGPRWVDGRSSGPSRFTKPGAVAELFYRAYRDWAVSVTR